MTAKPAKGAEPKEVWTTDLEDWTLETISNSKELLDGLIRNGVAEALCILATSRVRCCFAIDLECVSDPVDMLVEIADPDAFDEDVSWTFSLTDVVSIFIESNVSRGDDHIHGDGANKAGKVRDALRALADQIDARIAK